MGAQRDNGRTLRLVLPFVVAAITGVIVWVATRPAPLPQSGVVVDPDQQRLVNAVFAALGAMLVTLIAVRLIVKPRPKSRRSR